MVKQIFSFLRWQFGRFKWDDYLWMLGAGMIGAGWKEQPGAVFYIGLAIIWSMVVGALVNIQWQRWKAERKELLETIRDAK